jgi:DNA-binding NtrC family response regulator
MEAPKLLWIATDPPRSGEEYFALSTAYGTEWLLPEAAFEILRRKDFGAIVLSFPASGWTPGELFEAVQRLAPSIPVLIRDPHASVFDAVRLARLGVYQFLASGEEVAAQIDQAIEERRTHDLARLAEQVGREDWERLLIGNSREMRQVGHMIRLVGARRSTVLITGETGTGKELAARALHLAGARRRAPWVAVNCSALPEHLLEAELFGHVRGAFTGAVQNRVGRFEEAQGGTLFLDEIGDLPLDLQAKLLRVLQERELQRLGSSETIRLDVRVVAATNCDLAGRIEQGRFREDLYYRLNVVPIHMPPLRERTQDIAVIAPFLVEKICKAEGIAPKVLAPEAVERLSGYSWPGNVRQLENFIAMAVALSGDRNTLAPADFALPAPSRSHMETVDPPVISVPDQGMDYERTLAQIERSILEQALRKTGGNKKAAAEMLRLKRTTLAAKVRSLESVLASA